MKSIVMSKYLFITKKREMLLAVSKKDTFGYIQHKQLVHIYFSLTFFCYSLESFLSHWLAWSDPNSIY